MKKIVFISLVLIILFNNMTLAQLLANVGQFLGAPELNWSEKLSGSNTQTKPSNTGPGLFGSGGYIASPVSGGVQNWSVNNGVAQGGPQQGQTVSTNPTSQNIINNSNPGGSGGGGNPSVGSTGGSPNTGSLTDLARQALESKLNGINSRLAAIRDEGTRQIGIAGGARDEIKQNIDNSYNPLYAQVDTSKTNSLNALGEADRGVVRDYAQNQGSLNTTAENTMGSNRALARALGYGNSSYYMNTQDKTRSGLLDKTAGLQNEKTSKLGAIKQDVADTTKWAEQKTTDLKAEAQSLKDQADSEYQKQVGDIQFNTRTYGIDQTTEAEQAQNEYETKLAAIGKYIGDKANQISTIASAASKQGTDITGRPTIAATTQGTLDTNTGLNEAASPKLASIQGGVSDASSTGNRALISKYLQKLDPTQQYLYGYQQPLNA